MKRSLYVMGLISFLATAMSSCEKNKADVPLAVEGLKAYSGSNRAMVEFVVSSDARSGKVFYGSGNVLDFTVADAGVAQQIIVEQLPEEEQIIRVVTTNAEGISSEPRGVKVNVYGTKYQTALKPRKWQDEIQNTPTSIDLTFDNAFTNELHTWIVFTNTSGNKDSIMLNSAVNLAKVNNIDLTKAYYAYSVYKPNAEALDNVSSVQLDLKTAIVLDFKKSNWVIAGVSNEATGKEAVYAIDNNINNSWESQKTGLPQWITVDMDGVKLIDGFYYVSAQGNEKSPKNVKIEISSDNTTWTTALETEVMDTYLRQRLPLGRTVTARYFKITFLDSWHAGATSTQLGEIDAYNVQNISADNGKNEYSTSLPVPLVNAAPPFLGDGSDQFPAVGAGRMQKIKGWTHNSSAVVSFDIVDGSFSVFSAAAWGLSDVSNGKIYQTVNLQPGFYKLKIDAGKAEGPSDVYGVVTDNTALPNISDLATSSVVMKYMNVGANPLKTTEVIFSVKTASPVHIGLVYNTRDNWALTQVTPWTSFSIKKVELSKID